MSYINFNIIIYKKTFESTENYFIFYFFFESGVFVKNTVGLRNISLNLYETRALHTFISAGVSSVRQFFSRDTKINREFWDA